MTMTSIAAKVLEDAARVDSLLASTQVEKPLPLELDLGNMLAVDSNQFEAGELSDPAYLLSGQHSAHPQLHPGPGGGG